MEFDIRQGLPAGSLLGISLGLRLATAVGLPHETPLFAAVGIDANCSGE